MEQPKCPACKSADVTVKVSGGKTGVYCAKCGKWMRFIKNNQALRDIMEADILGASEGRAYKALGESKGERCVRCSSCKCILAYIRPDKGLSQYDLLNANFCPNCGSEFIDAQKKFRKERSANKIDNPAKTDSETTE